MLDEGYVEERYQQEALKRLRVRMMSGESVYEILHMTPSHAYYVNKIVQGMVPMSYAIYDRIMGCSMEDATCV